MSPPLVTVVIPAYNQAEYLGQAIESVLAQTFQDFEILVVDDASPDSTQQVVNEYEDQRLRYLAHERNRGLPAARNTGMRTARGDCIALLDADDFFHPHKLEAHYKFLQAHPEVGVTYNPRFNLHHSSDQIRDIWRPPPSVGLADLVVGFPFSPSDMVVRRSLAAEIGYFDESMVFGGEDLDFPCRLALAGHNFVRVDEVLNYRRWHSGRTKKNLAGRRSDYTRALERVFSDPRCPEDVLRVKGRAQASFLLEVAFIAFKQNESELGRNCLLEAIQLDTSLLTGDPSSLVEHLVAFSTIDKNIDHPALLRSIWTQLPPQVNLTDTHLSWTISQGYLVRGSQDVLWGQIESGRAHFKKAHELRTKVGTKFIRHLVGQLTNICILVGTFQADEALKSITPLLSTLSGTSQTRRLHGRYYASLAFENFRLGNYHKVPGVVIRAIVNNPANITNRGLLSILMRSAFKYGTVGKLGTALRR